MITCAHCGRTNDPDSRYCMDCGKPLSASAMAMPAPSATGGMPATRVYAPAASGGRAGAATGPVCSSCRHPVDAAMAFCASCGAKLAAEAPAAAAAEVPGCPNCGAPIASADYKFCPICATPLGAGPRASGPHEPTKVFSPQRASRPPVELVLSGEDGAKGTRYPLVGEETTMGRTGADVAFADDVYLSPMHALFIWKEGQLRVRDLGSRNGTWIFLEGPHRLVDGDQILIGSQLLRFRRLGYPGPYAPDADATRRMGSLIPSADIASLSQLRVDGSVRDVFHLSPGRDVKLGRDSGDWTFPYDPSMSSLHAQIRSEDADFVLADAGSRNGVAVAARGDVALKKASRILVGDKLLVVEMT
ncbi:MAG TPA: FHA domain-containing protein [Gemmatimonadales bacterium]|nr:FHA domain-containing protein [Gemmatimonadales bacterium]